MAANHHGTGRPRAAGADRRAVNRMTFPAPDSGQVQPHSTQSRSVTPSVVEAAIARLRDDLDTGTWHRRHADLLGQQSMDYGYRLLMTGA